MRFGHANGLRLVSMLTLLGSWSIYGHAQWLNHPTRGIPRTADGEPELSAPAPRLPDGTPDLSGFWNQPLAPAYAVDITADLRPEDLTPAASKLYVERFSEFGNTTPATLAVYRPGLDTSSAV